MRARTARYLSSIPTERTFAQAAASNRAAAQGTSTVEVYVKHVLDTAPELPWLLAWHLAALAAARFKAVNGMTPVPLPGSATDMPLEATSNSHGDSTSTSSSSKVPATHMQLFQTLMQLGSCAGIDISQIRDSPSEESVKEAVTALAFVLAFRPHQPQTQGTGIGSSISAVSVPGAGQAAASSSSSSSSNAATGGTAAPAAATAERLELSDAALQLLPSLAVEVMLLWPDAPSVLNAAVGTLLRTLLARGSIMQQVAATLQASAARAFGRTVPDRDVLPLLIEQVLPAVNYAAATHPNGTQAAQEVVVARSFVCDLLKEEAYGE